MSSLETAILHHTIFSKYAYTYLRLHQCGHLDGCGLLDPDNRYHGNHYVSTMYRYNPSNIWCWLVPLEKQYTKIAMLF